MRLCMYTLPPWVLLVLLVLTGCNDKSAQPGPEPLPSYSQYPIYFVHAGYRDQVYEYYPGTNQLDSIAISTPHECWMAVSTDGNRLFVGTIGLGTKVVDLVARQEEAQIDFDGYPAVSPDGDLLVIAGDGIRFYNAHTLELVHSIDTLTGLNPSFSPQGDRLYMSIHIGTSDTMMATIRVDQPEYPVDLRNIFGLFPRMRQARSLEISPDGKLLNTYYTWRGVPEHFFFAVADLEADTLVYEQLLFSSAPAGGMAVTPDGRRVFVAHPGNTMNAVIRIGPAEFLSYDVAENELDTQRVEGLGIVWPWGDTVDTMRVGDMVVTPDGRWLVCVHESMPVVLLYDAHSLELVDVFRMDPPIPPRYLACQRYGPPPPLPDTTTGTGGS